MLKAGKVLPSSMWVDLVAAAMEAEGGVGPFVLEGFPSDGSTLEQLEEKVGSSVSVVLRLDCDAETLGSRLAEREGRRGTSSRRRSAARRRRRWRRSSGRSRGQWRA